MKRRRVLLLLTEVFANGGIQRFNRTLLAAMETLPIDCDVVTFADDEEARAQWYGAGLLPVRTFARNKPAFAAEAVRAIASNRYDDVVIGHVHLLELAVSARLFRRHRPRMLMVAHGFEVWNRLNAGRRRALRAVEKILCVSEYTAQSILDQVPDLPANRFSIFPNALATLWVEQMGELIESNTVAPAAPFILSVARVTGKDRHKGIITTLEAFAQLPDRELRYVIAGSGDDLEFLKQIAVRLGVASRVDFPGSVTDAQLVGLYRACKAFVLPSGQEGFGIVFLEAMFFGAPVIAAREKGAVDVVQDGQTGLLVNYGDVVGLAAAITRVLGDEQLRTALCATARANVIGDGCFTASAFTKRLGAIFSAAPPPRRVVFVNRYFHPDESATSRMVSDLAMRLVKVGKSVSVVTSRQLYDDAGAELAASENAHGVDVRRVRTARWGRGKLLGRALDYLSFHLAARRELRLMLRPGDVVIAKTDPPLLSVTVARAARARGATLVNWLQDLFPEVASELGMDIRPAWIARLLLRRRNATLRQAAFNVAIGSRMAERLLACGAPAASLRIIPNWADTREIEPGPARGNPIRAELQIGDDCFVVGYSGNLGRAHEFDTFLGAARLLRDEPRFVFVVTGGGAKLALLRAQVEALGLLNFRFQNYQPPERLADSMAAADVHLVSLLPAIEGLIVPSKYYGILAAGRPAIFIGDPDGELAREIRSADTGLNLGVGDSAGLARELIRLDRDRTELARLGGNARRQAEERHSSEQALAAWLNLLASIPETTMAPDLAVLERAQSGT